ncbi:MAG TPA: endonuclease III [Persephonella sp.]|uniref:Endonuclease III n=1 Tax=Persephonella marina (strain DSM 14350 / EX-H1) TaxID=123214 RepID=C0QU82_PERMH|nr:MULTISPECIES: endonuclease III [Persephonella]ACO04806.1 endonuclease III [Persephonella marina EX-H1]HCB70138.1 endonuclease III [Persephonella sp.]
MKKDKKGNLTEQAVIEGLKKHFPEPWIDLKFSNPFQLLVATILAAQATDKKVNEVTAVFFKKYPDPESIAKAPLEQIENDIKQINFYRRKAKLLKECCEAIVKEFNGKIPDNIDDLTKLPGVGRKTASVILVNAFNKPAIVVDTHVKRVSQRLGITESNNPDRIEKDLAEFFSKENWIFISKAMVLFGRYICKAKNPKCKECALLDICPYDKKNL